MNSNRILVTGANGNLGQALLHVIGSDRVLACTRRGQHVPPEFQHITFDAEYGLPFEQLSQCSAVINAAGKVHGDEQALYDANVHMPFTLAVAAKKAGVQKFVQVSSFSIFGHAEKISGKTPEQPLNNYGRSKMESERQLFTLAEKSFAVESVRLPFMFSSENPALIGPLFKFAATVRLLPEDRGRPIKRSMITYVDAARQLAECAQTDHIQKSFAADTKLFDYDLVASIFGEETSVFPKRVSMPSAVVAVINAMAPSVGRRLFHSSVLDPNENIVKAPEFGIDAALRAIVRSSRSGSR